jgi:uncharacterized protein involved in response to NO
MNAQVPAATSPFNPAELLRIVAAAPHRLLFFGGATAVLLSMLWWAVWLLAQRSGWYALPVPALPAGWAHAIGMQYQALPMFMFGFLLTVFPRWMGLPAYARRHYIPVGGSLLLGYLAFHGGLLGSPWLVHLGIVLTLLGYAIGLSLLLRLLWLDGGRTWHAIACWCALALGFVGLLLCARYLHGGDARALFASIKIGTFGLLLPVFLTVCHRMLPFFSQAVTPGYQVYRPGWVLASMLGLIFIHLLLELAHAYAWLWLIDAPLAGFAALLVWRWRSNRMRRVRLLLVLHWGFAWLPVAFAMYALQSVWFAATGEFAMGRAPVHALTVGFFGSLLVAMVTRVTQGHSGRPLEMGRIPWICFLLLQLVALLRIAAEMLPDAPLWLTLSAIGWVIAFLPWVLRSLWIYLTPRLDRQPG